jgi:hypothetical protein
MILPGECMRRSWPIFAVMLLSSGLWAAANGVSDNAADRNFASTHFQLPLVFEANPGQSGEQESFTARGPGYALLLTSNQIALGLRPGRGKGKADGAGDNIVMQLVDAQEECELHGLDETSTRTNYFLGNDPAKWRTGVSTFGRVKYKNIYPGIDLVFYGAGRELEYDLVVHPGADPNRIKFSIKGATGAKLEEDGVVTLQERAGTVRFKAPVIYQEGPAKRTAVEGHFQLANLENGTKNLSFSLGAYDHSRSLTIDPVLEYSTYLGGSNGDSAGAVAVDGVGNAYLIGSTVSLNFPVTPGAVFQNHGACNGSCYDAFVAKISTTGNGLEYSTYLGGGGDDFGTGIVVDASGNAYVTGATNSSDFPTTGGALQRSCGGDCYYHDAFVATLNSTGSALLYSTYLGGSGEDWGSSIALQNGNAYVSGFSDSTDFPVTAGAFQTKMQGQGSSFVVQLNANATAEIFGTFLGEVDLFDAGGAIAVDAAGNSYVAGNTLSVNFPQTTGAFHTAFLSGLSSNMYILKLNSTGSALGYSALIGGASPAGIAIDAAGETYVAANAGSFSPVTPGAMDQSCDNGVLLVKFNAKGNGLLASSHICPDSFWPAGVTFDSSANFIFAGSTDSTGLPTTVGSLSSDKTSGCCFSDVVLGKVRADGSALMYLTYFGGNSGDNADALAQDSVGNVYVAGGTNSTNFPVRKAFQPTYAGGGDAFLSVFTLPVSNISVSPAVATFPTEGVGNATSPTSVTVANLSTGSISISSAVASGDFAVSNNSCGSELSAGTHCSIAVSFTPTASGNRSGTLTITDAAGVQTVRLSGVGTSGPFVAFSSAYQINTAMGVTSPPFPVVVTNTGNQNLIISQITLTNGPGFNFYGNTNCLKPVPPLGSCTVKVTFDGSYGNNYATLTLTDNASGNQQSFGLTGNVVGSGLTFTNVSLRFGEQSINTSSAAQQVALINGTGAQVTINSIKGSGAFVQSHTCGSTLAAGAYCYVKVTFKPASIGIKQGTISVSSSASGNLLVLPLLGTGD